MEQLLQFFPKNKTKQTTKQSSKNFHFSTLLSKKPSHGKNTQKQ